MHTLCFEKQVLLFNSKNQNLMKMNLSSNPFKTCRGLFLLLVGLSWTLGSLQAQCPGKSPTCRFVGTTATNDTIVPALVVGLNPGTGLATINIPRPALNTAGCGAVADPSGSFVNGTTTPRNDAGCSFANACNTTFGCGNVTLQSIPVPAAPATNSNNATTSPYDVNCGPVQIVMAGDCAATFGSTSPGIIVGGCNVGTVTTGNGTNDTIRVPKGLYNASVIATNGFIQFQPSIGWESSSTFGEGSPNFTVRVPTTCCESINNITNSCALPTFSGSGGRYYIRWTSEANDGTVTGIQQVVIQDLEPPTFVGCPKAVIINLGPGECSASWDAPPIMAMDNCPSANFVNEATSVGCNAGFTFCGYDAVNPSGFVFNLTNNTAATVAVIGFISSFSAGCAGITSTAGTFEVYQKTAANTGWDAGMTGYNGNPNTTGCNGVSPKALWTLVKRSTAADGIRALPVTAPARDTFYIGGTQNPTRDTVYACDGTFTVNVGSTRTSTLFLNPGETRGMFIGGGLGTRFEMISPSFGSCNTGRPFGDGKMQINTGIITGGIASNTAASIGHIGVCRPIGYVGDVIYATADNMIRVRQTCGQPYGPGCYFPIGCKTLCYEATDAAGNIGTCKFDVCVKAYPNTVTALACHDEIQISLNENCIATISADEVLSGGPYKCYDDYTVEVRDWITNAIIDRQANVPGVQVGSQDI